MTKKKLLIMLIVTICTVAVSVGATLAYLTAISATVENVFTIGEVEITLTETTGESYDLIPGVTVRKDPSVTVKGGSEDSFVFVKIEETNGLSNYISYSVAEGWTPLGGTPGVYYRQLVKTGWDMSYEILKDDCFSVKNTLTKEKMSAITTLPTLKITAYAVQSYGMDTVVDAWQEVYLEFNP